ncbi:MFS transporter [Longispora sp. K20-0274]|uniref:MFS transporter n=1 Tax=Longispora sp. K20-0274 TaxID=3088255 RepID=UPI00399BC59E
MTVLAEAAPSSAQTRRATLGGVSTTIASVIPVFLIGGLAVQLSAELHFDPAGLGLVVATYFGGSALAGIPAGAIVERFGAAASSRAAILVAAGSMLAVAGLAHSYLQLVLFLLFGSVANSVGQLAANTALAQRIPHGRQGLVFGIKQAAVPISTLLAGTTVPLLALTVGWRWAWVLAAVIALGALPLVQRDLARPVRRTERRERGATTALVVIGASATFASAAANALGTFLVSSSVARGIDPAVAGLTLTAGSAVCIAARILVGWLADRNARPGGAEPGGRNVAVLAGMLGVGAVGMALLSVAGVPTMVAGVLLAFGLGWAWPGLMNYAVVQLHPTAPASATAITQTGVYLGAFFGPLTLGTVTAHTSYTVTWLCAAGSMALAAVGMLSGARMLKNRQEPSEGYGGA